MPVSPSRSRGPDYSQWVLVAGGRKYWRPLLGPSYELRSHSPASQRLNCTPYRLEFENVDYDAPLLWLYSVTDGLEACRRQCRQRTNEKLSHLTVGTHI